MSRRAERSAWLEHGAPIAPDGPECPPELLARVRRALATVALRRGHVDRIYLSRADAALVPLEDGRFSGVWVHAYDGCSLVTYENAGPGGKAHVLI